MKGPTFRDELYADYKGTRAKTDDELIAQFPRVREVLRPFRCLVLRKRGWRRTIIWELWRRASCEASGRASPDCDGRQGRAATGGGRCDGGGAREWLHQGVRYDRDAVKAKMGVWPSKSRTSRVFRGFSDNIPACRASVKNGGEALGSVGSVEGFIKY